MCGSVKSIERFRPLVTFEFGEASYGAYHVDPLDVYELLSTRGYVIVDIRGSVLDARAFAESSVRQVLWDYVALPPGYAGLAERLRNLA